MPQKKRNPHLKSDEPHIPTSSLTKIFKHGAYNSDPKIRVERGAVSYGVLIILINLVRVILSEAHTLLETLGRKTLKYEHLAAIVKELRIIPQAIPEGSRKLAKATVIDFVKAVNESFFGTDSKLLISADAATFLQEYVTDVVYTLGTIAVRIALEDKYRTITPVHVGAAGQNFIGTQRIDTAIGKCVTKCLAEKLQ